MEQLDGQKKNEAELGLTVFQRLAPVSPNRAILFWFLVSTLLMAAAYGISLNLEGGQYSFMGLCIYQAAGLVIVPLGVGAGYKMLGNWALGLDDFTVQKDLLASTWFIKELEFVKGDLNMLLAGVLLGTAGVAAFYYGNYFSEYSMLPLIFVCLTIFVSASFAGAGLYAMFCVSRTFWHLGKLNDLSLNVHKHRFGILSAGAILFKCWMIIACIWAVYVASAFVGYQGQDLENVITLPPMWLLAYPTFPLIVGSFIICQYPLHQKMVEYKRTEIFRLEKILSDIKPKKIKEFDVERRNNIDFLDKQIEQTRSLPEWPFSLVSLLGTGATSVAAVFPALFVDGLPDWIGELFTI